ncbi:hypothetical protein niasHS_015608 [Heterodera schachtii]|uniref:Uncharacterized protein n=1 Tax=Heterodera schachtii TaxID=97005 RepID=A0ABD2HQV4_HETSC
MRMRRHDKEGPGTSQPAGSNNGTMLGQCRQSHETNSSQPIAAYSYRHGTFARGGCWPRFLLAHFCLGYVPVRPPPPPPPPRKADASPATKCHPLNRPMG